MITQTEIFRLATALEWAGRSLHVAGCTHSPEWADGRTVEESVTCKHYYKAGMSDLDKAIEIAYPEFATYRNRLQTESQFRTLNNPHLTTYREDDRKPSTSCPHCGNEDDYDEELRCPVCGLWNADQAAAKLYRLIELAKNFTDDELDKAFSLVISEVVE